MKVLVTGATGFLGGHTARRLHHLGMDVTGAGRNREKGRALEKEGIRFVQADLEEPDAIYHFQESYDAIVHSAALSEPWGAFDRFYQANVMATRHMIQLAQQLNVKRFVHISSPSIYFECKDQLNVKEEFVPHTFCNAYAETKYLAEKEIDLASQKGLPVITLRPRGIFGPEDNAIFPRLIRANQKLGIPRFKGINPQIDITYVDNVVEAILLSLRAGKEALGKKYNISNGDPLPLDYILERVFSAVGQPYRQRHFFKTMGYAIASTLETLSKLTCYAYTPLLTRYALAVLNCSQTLNIDAARKELGYSPVISVEEGISKFAKWWRENGR